MGMMFKETEFTTPKQILMFPDHYVAIPTKVTAAHPAVATVDGRKILKAGTIFPANDATAEGVVLTDHDLTDGDKNVAIVVHGFVLESKLPVAPAAAAKTALPMIKFFKTIV